MLLNTSEYRGHPFARHYPWREHPLARPVPQPDSYLSQTRPLARPVPQPHPYLSQTRPSSTVHQQIILRKYQCRMWYIVLSARMAYDIQCIVYSEQCIQRCKVNLFTIGHYQSIRCDRIYRKLCHSTVYSTQSTLYAVQYTVYIYHYILPLTKIELTRYIIHTFGWQVSTIIQALLKSRHHLETPSKTPRSRDGISFPGAHYSDWINTSLSPTVQGLPRHPCTLKDHSLYPSPSPSLSLSPSL